MRRSRKPIVIASRRSRLARVQAEMVARALAKLHPHVEIRFRWIESEGDRHDGVMLAQHGGKGLFTTALEDALLNGDADLAVHSLKDLPAVDRTGLAIAAIPPRADARDCLISRTAAATLDDLPPAAVVGTASPRRAAQLLRARPDLQVQLLRGNVDTRLRKVLDHDGPHPGGPLDLRPTPGHVHYDATLLAAAGLARLGLTEHLRHAVPLDTMLPAACQGALAIQCRADDHVTLTRCLPLNDPTTATAVHAERAIVAGLGADCHSPVAAYGEPVNLDPQSVKRNADAHWFRLRVRVLSSDGSTCLEVDEQCKTRELRRLVKQITRDLTARGAGQLLSTARGLPIRAPSPLSTTAAQAG